MITEVITWTMLKDKWPDPGGDALSLVVSEDGEDGPEFRVEDHCTCYEEQDDFNGDWHKWFLDENYEPVIGIVHAWTYGPNGKAIIDQLTAHLRPQINFGQQPASLIPGESELS